MDTQRPQLPVVTSEIGDTWIHGIASDGYKTAAMRALMRAHARVISSSSSSQLHAPPRSLPDGFAEFERLLLKCPEHTWGGDQKMFLHYGHGGDYFNWSNAQFQAAAADGEFDVRALEKNTAPVFGFESRCLRRCLSRRMRSSVRGVHWALLLPCPSIPLSESR